MTLSIDIHSRPSIVNSTLDLFMSAYAQPRERDVGCWDPELAAAAAEAFDDGAREGDGERSSGPSGGTSEGGAWAGGRHLG